MRFRDFVRKCTESLDLLKSNKLLSLWAQWLGGALLVLSAFYVAISWSSSSREIWIDEFLHFAVGSHNDVGEVAASIRETTSGFNHGQTGFHMMLNYGTAQVFGASAIGLRFPSVLATFASLLLGVAILRILQAGFVFQMLFLLFCFNNTTVGYYFGEARPYVLLIFSSLCTFYYYLIPSNERKLWFHLVGILGVGVGVCAHPYFSIYWLFIFVFAYVMNVTEGKEKWSLAGVGKAVNLWISIPFSILYFVIGKLTWLQGSPEFNLDPFQWIRAAGLTYTFFQIGHYSFLKDPASHVVLVLILVSLLIALFSSKESGMRMGILYCVGFTLGILAISFLLGYLSYVRDYWVLPRQWVASSMFVALGILWALSILARCRPWPLRVMAWAIVLFVAGSGLVMASKSNPTKQADRDRFIAWIGNPWPDPASAPPRNQDSLPADNEAWVALARENVAAGGKVWPIFRAFYRGKDE